VARRTNLPPDAPLGVFDSGLGGLTVVRALRERLPAESIVYLGDTARVPYGTRSPDTVVKYALGCSKILIGRGVKAIVVACNTVSAVALDVLQVELDLPVLGVIEPALGWRPRWPGRCDRCARHGGDHCVGRVRARSPRQARVPRSSGKPPLLVPLVEEGWTEGEVPRLAVRRYLEPLMARGAQVIVLGCTHYPLLRDVIEREARELAGAPVQVVDSAHATAGAVAEFLHERAILANGDAPGRLDLLVTDLPKSFADVASRFLGEAATRVTQIDL
jgi:glutamate racemase